MSMMIGRSIWKATGLSDAATPPLEERASTRLHHPMSHDVAACRWANPWPGRLTSSVLSTPMARSSCSAESQSSRVSKAATNMARTSG